MQLDTVIHAGAALVLLLGANQYSMEVAPDTYLSPVDPLVWLLFALWVVQRLRQRQWGEVFCVPLFTVLFLVLCALSLQRATNLPAGAKDLVQFAEYFVAAYLLFGSTLARSPRQRPMVYLFAGITAIVIAMAAGQYLQSGIDDFAVGGPFGNRNVLGGFLALSAPVLFVLALYDSTWWRRLLLLLVVAASLLVTLSGAAFIAIAATCILAAAWRGRAVLFLTLAAFALLLTAVLPNMPRSNPDVLYQSTAVFSDDGELKGRYPEWQAAAIMTLENPRLGVGLGNYQDKVGMYYGLIPSPNQTTAPDSQCLYLVLASSAGVPALLAFAGMLAAAIAAALRHAARSDGRFGGIAAGAAATGLGAFAIAAVWSPLLVRGIGIPLAFLLALAYQRPTAPAAAVEPETLITP